MVRRGNLVAALALLATAGACRDVGDGAHFELDGKAFVFNYRVGIATYLVNIKPATPVTKDLAAVVAFEDPSGGPDLAAREKIWPNAMRTTINSPPVHCVVKDHPYRVTIRIEDAAGAIVQRIDTTVTSSQDQTVMPDRPLVVGPLYTPNPDKSAAPPTDCPKR